MVFADLHMHALYGVDDGPKTKEEMIRMVEQAYEDGTRLLCLTPHFHPGYFGDNRTGSEAAFEELSVLVREKYPDLRLFLANELRCDPGCVDWLEDGLCRTLAETRNVLVDFSEATAKRTIIGGLERLLNGGYTPILAHAERYRELRENYNTIQSLRSKGVLIQITASSLTGDFGLGTRYYARKLLKLGLVEFVASDAHSSQSRKPGLSSAFAYIHRHYGEECAEALCWQNAERIFSGKG